MKRKLLFILFLVLLVGCAGSQVVKDPFLTTSYQALAVMDASYDLAWGGFVKLYKDGLVKEETFKTGRNLALDYFDKWTTAAKYLKQYASGQVGEGGFAALKAVADAALEEMKKYLKDKSGTVKPII